LSISGGGGVLRSPRLSGERGDTSQCLGGARLGEKARAAGCRGTRMVPGIRQGSSDREPNNIRIELKAQPRAAVTRDEEIRHPGGI